MTKIVKKIFDIKGMHCSSCAMNIDLDLEELKGVEKVKTSYAKQITEITYDTDKINVMQITQTIKKTGYIAIEE